MKKIIAGLFAMGLLMLINSCKKKEVDDVTITYDVSISNTKRAAYIEIVNSSGGRDVEVVNQNNFTRSYTVKSNVTKLAYSVDLYCYSKLVNGSSTNYEPQSITINIKEDDKVIKTVTRSGSASIFISSSDITADLPTAVKYKSK
jgi:hypothetical protein